MLGVATADLRNSRDLHNSQNNIYINDNGDLLCDGTRKKLNFKLNTGDKVIVRNNN